MASFGEIGHYKGNFVCVGCFGMFAVEQGDLDGFPEVFEFGAGSIKFGWCFDGKAFLGAGNGGIDFGHFS
jgi:hypothetical protein